jgi:hypothetical protein
LLGLLAAGGRLATPAAEHATIETFLSAASLHGKKADEALEELARSWRPAYAAMLLDMVRFTEPPDRPRSPPRPTRTGPDALDGSVPLDPAEVVLAERVRRAAVVRRRLIRFLERQTGQRLGDDLKRWRRWTWTLPYDPHPDYAAFKGVVLANADRRMRDFLPPGVAARIRLDEIEWGGVAVDGIPPLDHPASTRASGAGYLKDGHTVFGLVVNDEARAYPKRILAWHELVRDRLGGLEVALVYCTLCGSVIPYETSAGGHSFTFGTSGLLYRSNKLMYDGETRSLWSSLQGEPVVGPLAGSGLRLRRRPVVATTWREWKTAHPDTTVLALRTGHDRDYSEGAAYRDYFATDELMFPVPSSDRRLANKAEVLVFPDVFGPPVRPLAVSVELLARRRLFALEHEGRRLVIVTTAGGANRAYDAGDVRFTGIDAAGVLADDQGQRWVPGEDSLAAEEGRRRPRIAAHRAFWFAWHAQHPDTELVR